MGEDWSISELSGGKQIYLFIPIKANPDGLSSTGTVVYYEFITQVKPKSEIIQT
jgi:hypothetical protein